MTTAESTAVPHKLDWAAEAAEATAVPLEAEWHAPLLDSAQETKEASAIILAASWRGVTGSYPTAIHLLDLAAMSVSL
jgi:hypothetical protein